MLYGFTEISEYLSQNTLSQVYFYRLFDHLMERFFVRNCILNITFIIDCDNIQVRMFILVESKLV